MNKRRFDALFQNMERLRVGVLGDFCLDVYWEADMLKSQLSRETAHYTLPVVRERINLGGAGNAAANIAAVFPVQLFTFGVTGSDWRETVMLDLLHGIRADTSGFVHDKARFTNAFVKPLKKGLTNELTEDARLDFEPQTEQSEATDRALLERLSARMPELDVLCMCDQLTYGCVTATVREYLCSGRHKPAILADSRDRISRYQNVIIKPNDIEACRALGLPIGANAGRLKAAALELTQRTNRPVIVTMGENGCVVAENGEAAHVPAFPVPPPIDICGAGDTFLAITACAIAAGATLAEAAWLGNAGASLTIRQLHTTGTVTREALYAMCTEG